jgi:uncharacterized protein
MIGQFVKPYTYALVKPSGPDCNLACTYCFYYRKQELFGPGLHRMSDEVLETLIRKSLERSSRQFGFGWQGGEPTLMGLDFFKRAVSLQKQYKGNKTVFNSLQTNGMLIDEQWAEFLKAENFLVGISLDGEQHVHDRYRVSADGKGSHVRVQKNARLLLEAGVDVNALAVVNDYSVQFPEETYRYLKGLGFTYLQFIPIVETNPDNPREAAPYSVSGKAYGEFLCRLFDLWEADFSDGYATISIRLFDTFSHIYLGLQPQECSAAKTCGDYLVVEHNGEVFSCDFFVEDAWRLGNIMTDDPLEMLNSRRQQLFGRMKAQLPPACRTCPWLAFCRGGCPKDRIRDPRDKRFNHFCESYKLFFRYADTRFRKLIEEFKERQSRDSGGQQRPAPR